MDKGKQPSQGDWVTIAKKAKEPKVYVVFVGRQPGIYLSWPECQAQVYKFPGACYQAYDNMTRAKKAFYSTPPMTTPTRQCPREDFSQTSKPDESEIKDFFNPGIKQEIYNELNGVWKSHIVNNKGKFRKHMKNLANKLAEQTAKNSKLETLCFNIIKQMNWNEDFHFEKINNFLQLTDLISNEFSDPVFERIKRICLFEKAKTYLAKDNFDIIRKMVENHPQHIKSLLLRSKNKINFKDDFPKLTLFLNYEEWYFEDID